MITVPHVPLSYHLLALYNVLKMLLLCPQRNRTTKTEISIPHVKNDKEKEAGINLKKITFHVVILCCH